jgi:hypothetical protein
MDALFVRDPDPSWVAALAQIAPPNERIPWLLIHWEAGETWSPVGRWMIRELDPAVEYCDHLEFYEGPNPRTDGHWEGVGAQRRWRSHSLISERQWQLYRQYHCTSRRVWVVQGPNGGHPFALSQAERAFKRALGMSDADTPAPGSLPYAEPDQRTWRRLAEYDRLRTWEQRITWDERRETKTAAGLWVARDVTAEYERFGHAMLNFFSEGVREAVASVPRGTLTQLYDGAPKTDSPHDEEAIERRFVEAAPVTLAQVG